MQIRGARVLLTGASRGIGRALAEALAAAGAELALVARSAEPLEALAKRLGAKAYPADLADAEAVAALVERVEADGPVDLLINNAGVSNVGFVLDQKPEAIETLFRVNLLAPIALSQALIPGMLERGRGHIVNLGSVAGVLTPPGLTHYAASKAALAHYTAGLRLELKGLPIGFTLVQIGSTATDMDDDSQSYPPLAALRRGRSIESARFPIQRVVDGILDAVRKGRKHVVLPRSLRALTALVELPRKVMHFSFRKVSPRP